MKWRLFLFAIVNLSFIKDILACAAKGYIVCVVR